MKQDKIASKYDVVPNALKNAVKPTSPQACEKFLADALSECQSLLVKFPKGTIVKITATPWTYEASSDKPKGFKVYVRFRGKGGVLDDYWFVWIGETERLDKLISYCYDTYNYIGRNLFPHDIMFHV